MRGHFFQAERTAAPNLPPPPGGEEFRVTEELKGQCSRTFWLLRGKVRPELDHVEPLGPYLGFFILFPIQ